MKKIYISSTYIDLKEHRAAVEHALRKMNYHVCCMEDYVATDERVDARCTQDVMTCDFYVGIIAQRYGWIPPGQEHSITELEYRQARRQPNKTRCLMFVLDPDAEWPLPFVDALMNPDAAEAASLPCEPRRFFRGSLPECRNSRAGSHGFRLHGRS